jgi:hypothetical protein
MRYAYLRNLIRAYLKRDKAEVVMALNQDLWKHLRWQLNKRSK